MPELETPQMLLEHLLAVRDADYGSKLDRNLARLTAIEDVLIALLERLIEEETNE